MTIGRKATVKMLYNSKSADQMAPYLSSFRFSEVASGSSDSISVQLADPDRKWINGWFPKKGDKLKPTIHFENWEKDDDLKLLNCGTFIIDDFSFKGGPISCTIDALALPSTSGFKATERTSTYEKTTIKEIGEKIADRNGLTLVYDADKFTIESVAQDKKTDCAFLNELVIKYGLALKIFNDRLVIFDEAVYEQKAVVATLTEEDFEPSWKYNTSLAGTYTGMQYSYTNSKKGKTYNVEIGGGDRIMTCDDEASNLTEATRIAVSKLNNANKGTTTMQITLRGTWKIVATSCVQISGLGMLDGKYYVERADTSISGSGGTKLTLSLRKVEKRFVKVAPPEEPIRVYHGPGKQATTGSSVPDIDAEKQKASTSPRKKRIIPGTAAKIERRGGPHNTTVNARGDTVRTGSTSSSKQKRILPGTATLGTNRGPANTNISASGKTIKKSTKEQKPLSGGSTTHQSSSGGTQGGHGGGF